MGNLTRLITDTLLILLLITLLALPASSLGILGVKPQHEGKQVLSTQDARVNKENYPTPAISPNSKIIEERILKESTPSVSSTSSALGE